MKKLLLWFSLFPSIVLILGGSAYAQQTKKRPTPKPPVNVRSDSSTAQTLPTYGSITDIKHFNRIYVFAEDAESRERIVKAFRKAPQFQIIGSPQNAQIILEYKVLSRDRNMDRGNEDSMVKSQLNAIYVKSGKRVIAWSDTAQFRRLLSGGIGFRSKHNESKLTERFIKAMKN